MTHFKARRRGGVLVELPAYAAGLLANLAAQLVELLSDGEPMPSGDDDPLEAMLDMGPPREKPTDPALLRLLPDAHRNDADASSEFRRFTERGIREAKIADALTILDKVGREPESPGDLEFELNAQEARSWLRSMTDIRLTLAERIGVTADDEEFWESLPADDERLPVHEIYGWLGFLLESLLDVVRK